jgi:glycosyltransferase involved in cell wall biosynthesis
MSIVGPWKTSEGGGGEAYLHSLKSMFAGTQVELLEPIYDVQRLNLLYKQAAIFVYPSVAEKGETFGLAPLEAMAWGAVPVVSDLQCFKDFIVDGENGSIFNHRTPDVQAQLMDCVLGLINDSKLRQRMGTQALSVRQTHSPNSIADRFLADFKEITT